MKKKQGHSPVELIIHKRRWIEKIFSVLFVFSLLCIPLVNVNYDLTEYLPDDAPSAQAIDIMEKEFTYPGIGRILLQDVTLREAKDIKDRIADVDGVDMILWCDSTTNIYGSSEFIDYDDIEDYYKDGDAYLDITFLESDSSDRTHAAVREIQKIIDGKGLLAGSAASDTEMGPTLNTEIAHVMMLAVAVIFLILALTTNSWFEPVLFLTVMGVAIIIGMNKGETLRGPFSISLPYSVSNVFIPPMPVPNITEKRSGATVPSMPLSSTACCAAATANCA